MTMNLTESEFGIIGFAGMLIRYFVIRALTGGSLSCFGDWRCRPSIDLCASHDDPTLPTHSQTKPSRYLYSTIETRNLQHPL